MKKLLITLFCLVFGFLQAQEIGIVGPAAGGWPTDDDPTPDIMLTNNGDGTYSIDALTLTTGPAKFRQDQDWAVNYGGSTFPSGPITGNDIPVQAGVYDIVLDLNDNTYSFTDVGTFDEIEITGSALSEDVQLSTADGDVYEAGVTQFMDGTVVFVSSNGDTYGGDDFPTGPLILDGNPIPVDAGFYEVKFFVANNYYSFDIPDIGIVGPGVSEWPGDNPTPDVLMNSTDGAVYTLDSQEFFDDEVKFRQNLSWNTNWGGTGFPTGNLVLNGAENIVAEAGVYDVSFDRQNQTYMFVTLSTDEIEFNTLKVYPNPTQGNWNIQVGNADINRVSIFSISGKLVKVMQVSEQNEIEINAANLDAGMYMIKLSTTSVNVKTLKLIKH